MRRYVVTYVYCPKCDRAVTYHPSYYPDGWVTCPECGYKFPAE
jgi:endogenous inhibitor of DNA gyrase (YacG/DUF329 family)